MSRRSPEQKRQEDLPPWMRIEESAYPDPIRQAIDEWHATSRPDEPEPDEPDAGPVPALPDEVAGALATDLWRATRRVGAGNGTADASEETEAALRDLDRMRERLRGAGIEYEDHDGLVYKDGMDLDVLSWQPTTDVPPDVVLKTVRPSVYRTGSPDPIQIGRVIVAKSPQEG